MSPVNDLISCLIRRDPCCCSGSLFISQGSDGGDALLSSTLTFWLRPGPHLQASWIMQAGCCCFPVTRSRGPQFVTRSKKKGSLRNEQLLSHTHTHTVLFLFLAFHSAAGLLVKCCTFKNIWEKLWLQLDKHLVQIVWSFVQWCSCNSGHKSVLVIRDVSAKHGGGSRSSQTRLLLVVFRVL